MFYAMGQMWGGTDQNLTGRLRAAVRYCFGWRKEEKTVRGLLAFLRTRSVLYSPLYREHPLAALGSVRRMRTRLREDLERLPPGSRAFRPVREMHEACLGFLTRISPLPMPGETELSPDKLADGVYWRTLQDALVRLRETFDSCIDELCEDYGMEKPPPGEIKAYAARPPWRKPSWKPPGLTNRTAESPEEKGR